MLSLQITIDGDKVLIEGLAKLAAEFPETVKRGLIRSAKGIYQQAFQWLSGPGAKGTSREVTSKTGKKYLKWDKQTIATGGYPVPVRTGWLRRCLNWLKPGESKTGDAGIFTAGENEVVIYDSARYAKPIHDGTGSSAKFGPRRFIIDAFEMFNRGLGVQMAIRDEIQKLKVKS